MSAQSCELKEDLFNFNLHSLKNGFHRTDSKWSEHINKYGFIFSNLQISN